MQFDQGGAGLGEAAVVSGELAEAGALPPGQRAQAGRAALGPGQHGGGVERAVRGSAAAGGSAATGLQFIDRALEELTEEEQVVEALPAIGKQRHERLAQAAGTGGGDGHGRFSCLCYIF